MQTRFHGVCRIKFIAKVRRILHLIRKRMENVKLVYFRILEKRKLFSNFLEIYGSSIFFTPMFSKLKNRAMGTYGRIFMACVVSYIIRKSCRISNDKHTTRVWHRVKIRACSLVHGHFYKSTKFSSATSTYFKKTLVNLINPFKLGMSIRSSYFTRYIFRVVDDIKIFLLECW